MSLGIETQNPQTLGSGGVSAVNFPNTFLHPSLLSVYLQIHTHFGKEVWANTDQLYSRVDLAIVVLGVHDDYQVGSHVHAPAETPRSHHHLDSP